MWNLLLHLGTAPSSDLMLACPLPPAGQPADPEGFYDMVTVSAGYDRVALLSIIVVVLAVLLSYQTTHITLGPRFVKRWYIGLALTAVLCAAVAWGMLSFAPITALAGSCETNPDAFVIGLPMTLILPRALAGLVWGALAYTLLSVVLTSTVGRLPMSRNGFFHNRGCPWPRFTP